MKDNYFCHPINGDWTKHPLPNPNPLTLAADVPACGVCPLACHAHILVPSPKNENGYTKYCTITAIITGLITIPQALSGGQAKPTNDDIDMVEALVDRLGHCAKTCTRRAECLAAGTGCLIKQAVPDVIEAPAPVIDDTPAPEPEPEQPLQVEKPRPRKPCYIFGWMSAETSAQLPAQLYVEKSRNDWGVTYDPAQASRFKSIDAVLDYYRTIGSVHGDPEINSYTGYLKIFEDGAFGLRPVPQPTRQGGLFDNLQPLEIVEKQPDLIKLPKVADCFTRDENKLLDVGYILVRYDRAAKTIQRSHDNSAVWIPTLLFTTYAAAEKTLKEMLKLDNVVEVSLDGKVNLTTCRHKLLAAGFDFYRSEGIIPGHGHDVPRIKQGSINWGTWGKYEQPYELKNAWDELMKDEKALCG